MKKFLLVALFSSLTVLVKAQGVWNGGDFEWNYNLDGPGGDGFTNTVSGSNFVHASSAVTATFLPKPPSGTVAVISSAGATTFTRAGSGADASIKITASNTATSPGKFSVYDIPMATPVMGMFFTLKLSNISGNTDANWYVVLGTTHAIFKETGNNVNLSTTNTHSSDSYVFGCFRIIRSASFPTFYNFSVRKQIDAVAPVFVSGNSTTFAPGNTYQVEIYCNNSDVAFKYTLAGVEETLPSRKYQVWVNGKKLGEYDASRMPINQNINSVSILNREAAKSGTVADNSAEATISNFRLTYPITTLPVSLNSFTGKKQDNTIQLNWSTVSEQKNSHFEVLRSGDGATFDVIGKVNGNGNSSEVKAYSFIDNQPLTGTNYYKLRQVDFNGNSTTSEQVVAVKTDLQENSFSLSATADNQVKASIFSANATSGRIQISDISGRKIYDGKINLSQGVNQTVLAAPVNTPGVYVGVLSIPEQTISLKFLK